ncbi:MAG: hypothetical protein RJA67_76 [Bacteroidota bacterium]|jgi:hypothetical protein
MPPKSINSLFLQTTSMFPMNKLFVLISVITFLLVFEKGTAESRNLDWINTNQTKLRKRINLDELSFEAEIKTNEWIKLGQVSIQPNELTELLAKHIYADPFQISNQTTRFVLQGTGLIYDFDEREKRLKRVDKTVHSGYNFGSHRFYRNNVLYSIGGEGFWSYNKRLTYYDEKTSNEWELVRPKNEGPKVISDGYQGYSKQADAFFSGGSLKKNFLENEEIITLTDLFKFDFKSKSWVNLGKINFPKANNAQRTIFWNGTHFVQLERDRVYFLNPLANTIHVYADNTSYFEEAGNHYVSHDTVMYYNPQNKGNLRIIAVNNLLKKSTYVGEFYDDSTSSFPNYAYVLILCILIAIIFLVRKKREKSFKLDEVETKLLTYLFHANNHTISTLDLNELLDCSTKSQENQRRIRYLILNQLNQKLENHLNIKNAIERTPSEEDKRIFNYHLKLGIESKIQSIIKSI